MDRSKAHVSLVTKPKNPEINFRRAIFFKGTRWKKQMVLYLPKVLEIIRLPFQGRNILIWSSAWTQEEKAEPKANLLSSETGKDFSSCNFTVFFFCWFITSANPHTFLMWLLLFFLSSQVSLLTLGQARFHEAHLGQVTIGTTEYFDPGHLLTSFPLPCCRVLQPWSLGKVVLLCKPTHPSEFNDS